MRSSTGGWMAAVRGRRGVVTADIEDEEERSACRDARKANGDVERRRGAHPGHVELNKVS